MTIRGNVNIGAELDDLAASSGYGPDEYEVEDVEYAGNGSLRVWFSEADQ